MNRTAGDLHQPKTSFAAAAPLNEATDSRTEYILKLGLASDPRKIVYYRRVLKDPKRAPQDALLREPAGDVLSTLLNILFTDQQVWNRVKTVLMRRKQKFSGLRENISDSGLRSLIEKSVEKEVPLETIFEVYSRGAQESGEKGGFGRVNSFLAGGKAADMDADLFLEEPKRLNENKKHVLSTARRVLREKKSAEH